MREKVMRIFGINQEYASSSSKQALKSSRSNSFLRMFTLSTTDKRSSSFKSRCQDLCYDNFAYGHFNNKIENESCAHICLMRGHCDCGSNQRNSFIN